MVGNRALFPARAPRWTYLWASVPLMSLGLLTPLIIGHAAAKLRSAVLGIGAGLYLSAAVVATSIDVSNPSWALNALASGCLLFAWFGGTVHALILRPRVFAPVLAPGVAGNLQAIEDVALRRRLRDQARRIVTQNPDLARELMIGRPDLPRTYDDGGLIDANHAPVDVLVSIPEITMDIALAIKALREARGPFASVEDLAASLRLDPNTVIRIGEYTVYPPR